MKAQEREIINKHKERSREGYEALQKFVIDQKLCNYCGSCVSVCPKQVLAMGPESPELTGDCNGCGLCYLSCPRTFLPMTAMQQWSFGTDEIPPLGTHTRAVLAGSNSEELMAHAADGGIVTTLFQAMLKNGLVDAVITTGKQHDCVWCFHPRPRIVTDPDDLLACIDRKYDPNPLLTLLKDAVPYKKVAFAGLACHVLGLKKLQYAAHAYKEVLPALARAGAKLTANIEFVVGIGCMCRMGKGAWDVMLKEAGVDSEELVVRHYEERISGDYVFHLQDGGEARVSHMRIIEDPHHMCFQCCDYDGYFSDMTSDRSEFQPYSTILLRTGRAGQIFDQCLHDNLLHIRDMPHEGEDFVRDMTPVLQSLVEQDIYGYEHFLKEGTFSIDPDMQQMMGHFENRRMRGLPENIFLELLKKYPQFEFARKKREQLGYVNPDIF